MSCSWPYFERAGLLDRLFHRVEHFVALDVLLAGHGVGDVQEFHAFDGPQLAVFGSEWTAGAVAAAAASAAAGLLAGRGDQCIGQDQLGPGDVGIGQRHLGAVLGLEQHGVPPRAP